MKHQWTIFCSVSGAVLMALCASTAVATEAAHATTPACQAVAAPKEAFEMQVPFEVIDGRIYLQARVNGRGPFKFAVDTGASGIGRADSSLVSDLGLALQRPTLNSDGVKTTEADTTRIESLSIGGMAKHDLQVITRDYNSRMSPEAAFAGIVARDFFGDGLLIIDYPRKVLSFSKSLSLDPKHQGVLRYERPFRVPVSIGALQTEGNLDTGANVTFVMPQALFDKVVATPAEPAGKGQLANTQIETKRATVRGPFRIGGATVSGVEVRISDEYPELLVGAHILKNYAVLIDQRSKSVTLCQ